MLGIGYTVAFAGSQEKIGIHTMLAGVEIPISALQSVKRLVRAALHDAAVSKDENPVGVADGRDSVRDDEAGAIASDGRASRVMSSPS